ncbi:dnaJ homolog subfamily C member 30, mitochondrial [Erythrolamprus reginae]|uniref:dnaJ homolog subfamily C member 30, mitochondrial n=1 Tax=Erythrolamprus reginae TaxID=121349 RepID=UPI00396C3DD8
MALARSQRQSRASSAAFASDFLRSSYGAAGLRPQAALPPLVFPVAFRERSGPGQGNGREGEGGNIWRRARPKDLYELLGVPSNATQTQIKAAYYKQSFLCHPDRNAGSVQAADRFIRLTQAYQVLGSLSLRKKYDRGLLTPEDISNAKKPPGKSKAAASASQAASKKKPPPPYTSAPPPGKPIFNFDKFYRAHYGEQLERERLSRLRQQELKKHEENRKEDEHRFLETFLIALLISGVMILLRYH